MVSFIFTLSILNLSIAETCQIYYIDFYKTFLLYLGCKKNINAHKVSTLSCTSFKDASISIDAINVIN